MKAIVTFFAVLMLLCAVGCGKKDDAPDNKATPETAAPVAQDPETVAAAQVVPAILSELKNATYTGILEQDPVTLVDGYWEGAPVVEGGASRPHVNFVGDFHRLGDMNGDGQDDVAVVLAAGSGGTGENIYLAVMEYHDGKLKNLDTALLGDRVQIRKAAILEGRLFMDVVQPGPNDSMSNPGELAVYAWTLKDGKLVPMEVASDPLRLTLDAISGNGWKLARWDFKEAAPLEPAITLEYADGKLSGKSACNSWFTSPVQGKAPGEITLGPTGGTMMMCEDEVMAMERRFLAQLEGVRKFGYLAAMLALTYEVDGKIGVMLFDRIDEK